MTFFLAALDHARRQLCRAGGVWVDALLTARSPLTYEKSDYQDLTEEADPDYEAEAPCECGHPYHPSNMCTACECTGWAPDYDPTTQRFGLSITPEAESVFRSGGQTYDTPPRPKLSVPLPPIDPGVAAAPQSAASATPGGGEAPSDPAPPPGPPLRVDGEYCCGGGDNWGHEWNCKVLKAFAAAPASPGAGLSSIALPMYDAKDLEEIAAEYIAAPVTEEFLLAHPDMEDARTQWSRHVAELVVSALTFELQSRVYDQNNPQTQ